MHSAFVARQPIFDLHLDVVGCEMVFRGGWAGDEAPVSAQQATATVVVNSLTELDFKTVAGAGQAWVEVPREFVLDGLARAIPARLSGLRISGEETFDEPFVAALRELKEEGYRLALDAGEDDAAAVLDLFDVVRLDVAALGAAGLAERVARLRAPDRRILAAHISTYAERDLCIEAGVDLLEGSFICQPAIAASRGISANRLALMQVVAGLQQPDITLEKVQELVARDVALSVRMLRYVNSAMVGLRAEVRSIGHALTLLGLDTARRWATVSAMASVDDKPSELTMVALTRGRFCELAGAEAQLGEASELFTLGLLSVLDALTDAPMGEATETLGLADDLRAALVERRGALGALLDVVEARERGDDADTTVPHVDEHYLSAVIWAGNVSDSLFAEIPSLGVPIASPAEPSDETPPVAAPPGGGVLRRWLAALRRLLS